MQIIGYDWRCTREEWNAEGINHVLVLHILFPPWYSIIYEKQVVFNVCSIVCVDFLHCFFLFLVFLMIIFCRMPLINLNLGISIKLTKLSWPFFPRIFSFSDTWAFGRSKVPLELSPWQTNHAPFDWHVIHLRKARWNGSGLVMDLPMALTPNALLNLVYMDSASRPESYDAFIKRWNSGFLRVVNQFVSQVFITKKKKHEAVL